MGSDKSHTKTSLLGILITIGIVYGDIGTSPLYVMRAITYNQPISEELILGALSCIIWTLTIQATLKYIWIAMSADNKGEGGIFALYALVRKLSPKKLIFIAMIGCSALLADSIITPAITITAAIEGLQSYSPGVPVTAIVLIILAALFTIQQIGTKKIGKAFGPIMLLWFVMLGLLGLNSLMVFPAVLKSINPVYAVRLIFHSPSALILIGAIFLCVTGAEALYSDLGHCGKGNIRLSWILVKPCLILNYMGQGAWLMNHNSEILPDNINPFYEIMPEQFLPIGIVIASIATVIASQAVITGSFSLINEAVKLKVWYRLNIMYPTEHRQQLYIPTINWMLFLGCAFIVIFFKKSSNMEAMYGLAITIAMLSTTLLLIFYFMRIKKFSKITTLLITLVFLVVEGGFFYACLQKLSHGAWFSLMITGMFFGIMFLHYRASRIRSKALKYYKLEKFIPLFQDLINDETVPKFASHLVYLINANRKDDIEASVINSVFRKNQLKRAEVYWFINIHVTDEPYTSAYKVTNIIPQKFFRVDFYLGYRMHPSMNILFNKVVEELSSNGEVSIVNSNPTLQKHGIPADFLFITIEKKFAFEDSLHTVDKLTVKGYELINRLSVTAAEHFNLTTENLMVENQPIIVRDHEIFKLTRVY